jgi:hypothetical protein
MDHALYFYQDHNDDVIIINASTDDLLCAFSDRRLFMQLHTFLSKYVTVSAQSGSILNYLNLRIVQSPDGISYDQTQHIKDTIIDFWFKPSKQNNRFIKPVDTPFRTDSDYERELADTLPADEASLQTLELEYGATYASDFGRFMHVCVWSHAELSYASSKPIAIYSHSTSPSFRRSQIRMAHFLYAHPHRPIFYPSKVSLTGTHTLKFDFDKGKFAEHIITNGIAIFVDADHGCDKATRQSIEFLTVLLGGVSIDESCKQQGFIALNSTDAETGGLCKASKKGVYYYKLAKFFTLPIAGQPVTIYEDSQPAIDLVSSNAISSHAKHIATAIAYSSITRTNRPWLYQTRIYQHEDTTG